MNFPVKNKPLPKGAKKQIPTRIVIHSMGEYIKVGSGNKHAYDFLKDIGLSAHALICPDGMVMMCRDTNQGAYHARGFNKNSLGVEFLVAGQHDYSSFITAIKEPYLNFDQYVAGVELIREWCRNHDISSIDRHSDLDPTRKKDPGNGFDWEQFIIDVEGG